MFQSVFQKTPIVFQNSQSNILENHKCISEISIQYQKKKKNVICTRISENVVIYISLFSEIKVRYSNIQLRILK